MAKEGSPVTVIPEDGQDYEYSNTFGLGDDLGDGNFVVYDGDYGNSQFIYGLNHSTAYYFKVFEYNGTDTNTYYLTSSFLEGSQSTLTAPTIQASNAFVNSKTSTSINLSWTNGNGDGRLLIARADSAVNVNPVDLQGYGANSNYGTNEIGNGNYVIYNGNQSTDNVLNLEPNINYHFALFEYNGNAGKVYLTPPIPSKNKHGAFDQPYRPLKLFMIH